MDRPASREQFATSSGWQALPFITGPVQCCSCGLFAAGVAHAAGGADTSWSSNITGEVDRCHQCTIAGSVHILSQIASSIGCLKDKAVHACTLTSLTASDAFVRG